MCELGFQSSRYYHYTYIILIDFKYAHTGDRGNWTDRGCETEYIPGSCRVLCKCSHLTNFAALVVSLYI